MLRERERFHQNWIGWAQFRKNYAIYHTLSISHSSGQHFKFLIKLRQFSFAVPLFQPVSTWSAMKQAARGKQSVFLIHFWNWSWRNELAFPLSVNLSAQHGRVDIHGPHVQPEFTQPTKCPVFKFQSALTSKRTTKWRFLNSSNKYIGRAGAPDSLSLYFV